MTSITHTAQVRWFSLLMMTMLAMPVMTRPAQAQADATFESSVYLLRASLTVDRRQQYSMLLRSLRQLSDAELAPLYKDLLLSENRVMRIHGILGLAEIDPKRQLDLTLVAEVKDGTMQSELLGAALDSDLLDVAAAKQVIGWPATDMDAKVVIATHLLEKKEFNDVKMLKLAAETKSPPPPGAKEKDGKASADRINLARQGIVGLLLTQLGDPAGDAYLSALDKSTEPSRDETRSLVLQTAFRFKFERVAPWAAKLATEPGVSENLGLLALRTAMRFGDKESMKVWTQQYQSAVDAADRMRLAISLLNLAPYVDAAMFDPIIASTDPLTKQIGLAGRAAATKTGVAGAAGKLIAFEHGVANGWALGYANFHADADDARAIFTDLILGYERSSGRNKAQRLDEAMVAAQALFEKDAKAAGAVLKPILDKPTTDKQLVQGILVGLIRVTKGEPHKVVEGLNRNFSDTNSNGLKLLLQAKHGVPLQAPELKDLGLLVRGGGSLPDALRLQAAWAYLKQTKQTAAALTNALKR